MLKWADDLFITKSSLKDSWYSFVSKILYSPFILWFFVDGFKNFHTDFDAVSKTDLSKIMVINSIILYKLIQDFW